MGLHGIAEEGLDGVDVRPVWMVLMSARIQAHSMAWRMACSAMDTEVPQSRAEAG